MKFKSSAVLAFSIISGFTTLHAEDSETVSARLSQEADFKVSVHGVHVDKFELGLFELDAESKPTKRVRLPRDGCFQFFKNQKHKGMVLVRYVITPIEDWDPEIERTVKFFQDAGYARAVLLQGYSLSSGITIIHDTSNRYGKLQFIPPAEPHKKNES